MLSAEITTPSLFASNGSAASAKPDCVKLWNTSANSSTLSDRL
jgi:hypothetical protein